MQNENVVEIGIRGAKSKTFRQTIVIHKKHKAISKNTLNQNSRLIVVDLLYVSFIANWFKFFVQSSVYNSLENPFLSAFKGLASKIF